MANEEHGTKPPREENEFPKQVGEKEQRMLEARRRGKESVWQGFSVFGLIGWSVSIPTIAFVLLGLWLDERYAAEQSFTLALLVAGLFLGCLNAWYWVSRKMKEIQEKPTDNDGND